MAGGIIASFRRYEVKYFLTRQQFEHLFPILEEHLAVDSYGKHTISNIFLDTDQFDITRASIEKPVYKEKLRIRAYGCQDPEQGKLFIELKKKYDHVVYKRRIAVTPPEAKAFLRDGIYPPHADPQITREIAHFMKLHRPTPKVFLSYDRIAMFGKEDPELRITFDQNLLWRDTDLDICTEAHGQPILPDDRVLMEIKVPGAMPLWLARTLSEMRVFPTSFSKIGTCYKNFIIPKIFSKKVVTTHV